MPPIGIYNTTDCLSLPRDASVTLRFDEVIVDKEGMDFAFYMPVQGAGEFAQVWMGATPDAMQLLTRVNSVATVQRFDIAGSAVRPPVRVPV